MNGMIDVYVYKWMYVDDMNVWGLSSYVLSGWMDFHEGNILMN